MNPSTAIAMTNAFCLRFALFGKSDVLAVIRQHRAALARKHPDNCVKFFFGIVCIVRQDCLLFCFLPRRLSFDAPNFRDQTQHKLIS